MENKQIEEIEERKQSSENLRKLILKYKEQNTIKIKNPKKIKAV